jgi:hypothetical protein
VRNVIFLPRNTSRPHHLLLLFIMPYNLQLGSYTAAIGGIAAVLGLDVLAVGARFYVRKALKHKLNLNDWLVIPALVRHSCCKNIV